MSITDFIQRLGQIAEDIKRDRTNESLRIAFDTLALTKLRVQTQGTDFELNPFDDYTTPYKRERVKRGAQIERVDFTVSGEAWNSIRPEVTDDTETTTTIEISSNNDLTIKKLEGFAEKRPNVLLPSQDEIDFATQQHIERVQKKLVFS